MKVLFVQEHPFLATALKLTMLSKGFDLILLQDNSNPHRVLEQLKPAVVIADISELNGLRYLEQAKLMNVPVIVISANDKEDNLQKAFEKGADDYICLPLSLTELALRVKVLTNARAIA